MLDRGWSTPMTFEKTILSTFGKTGKEWLEKLPEIISMLKEAWSLSHIIPVENMTYHYVTKAIRFEETPVVIKIGCDAQLIQNEAALLQHYNGDGAIPLIDYKKKYNALLLEQAVPGHSLKSLYPKKSGLAMQSYANVVQKIQDHPAPKTKTFPTISDWLSALDKAPSSSIDRELLSRAISIKNKLLSSMKEEKLLHGDLHLDNILENKGRWICIDPKGVIGEIAFEVAAFDVFDDSELEATRDVYIDRIQNLAEVTDLSFDRLKDWFFVRLVLSAVWSVEDGADPSKELKIASLIVKN